MQLKLTPDNEILPKLKQIDEGEIKEQTEAIHAFIDWKSKSKLSFRMGKLIIMKGKRKRKIIR